mmetsp:Transcript_21034/g.63268  ORF Transcript_21034/g.63268 Transcript_21034/m.63268 type:complete len:208 (+) Transcript_21034:1-624(+)
MHRQTDRPPPHPCLSLSFSGPQPTKARGVCDRHLGRLDGALHLLLGRQARGFCHRKELRGLLHARHRLIQLFLQRGPLRLLGTPQLGLGRKLRLLREDLFLFGEIVVHERAPHLDLGRLELPNRAGEGGVHRRELQVRGLRRAEAFCQLYEGPYLARHTFSDVYRRVLGGLHCHLRLFHPTLRRRDRRPRRCSDCRFSLLPHGMRLH